MRIPELLLSEQTLGERSIEGIFGALNCPQTIVSKSIVARGRPRLALYRDMVHRCFPLSGLSSLKISLQACGFQELCLTDCITPYHPLLGSLSADNSAVTVK